MKQIRKTVRRIGSWAVAATAALVLTVQPVMAEAPAALSQAPDGAQLVVIVPNMAEFSGKLAMLNQNLGLDIPELADALGAFKAEAGIGDALNDNGSAIIAIKDLATAIDTGDEPDILMIMPVTDYQAFIAGFQGEGAEPAGDGVTAITMPDGQSGFAKEANGYAIMGNTESAVTNYAAAGDADTIGNHVGELANQYLGVCDAAVYVNVEALAPVLGPKIDEGIAEFNNEMDQMTQMGMMDPGSIQMMNAAMVLYAKAGKAILNSAQGLVVTLDVSEHGVGFTYAGQFKPDSVVMKYLPGGQGGSTSSMLSRLPGGSYIVAGAFDAEAIAGSELFEKAMAALPQDNAQIDLYRKALPLMKQVKQYAGVWYTPSPEALQGAMMGAPGAINILQTYKVEDGPSYLTATKDYINSMNGTSIPMGMPMQGGQPANMTYVTSYTDNALQLDGVQVDQYSMQTQMPQEMMMMMGPMAPMMQMFTNFNGYATQTDGYYLASTTLDQQLMTRAIATGKAGDGLGVDDALAAVREKAVPDGAIAEGYLSLGGVLEAVGPMAMMFGMPPIETPADLPPVAMGLGVKENSTAARFYVPNDTTRFIIQTVKDIQAQMMGPGPGGPGMQGGPGAPPPPF